MKNNFIVFGLSILFVTFGFNKKPIGCIYYQPTISNGILTSWDETNGSFTVYPTCPKCSAQNSSGLMSAEGYTAGKTEKYGSCLNRECVPKGDISYQYRCIISWPSPKCN
jgi:hypothetical protein